MLPTVTYTNERLEYLSIVASVYLDWLYENDPTMLFAGIALLGPLYQGIYTIPLSSCGT